MPNIKQLILLNKKYNKLLKISHPQKITNRLLNESQLKKEAGFDVKNLIEHFDLKVYETNLLKHFSSNSSSNVVLLFIDIYDFSNIINKFTNMEIKTYLDNYYKRAFPIILSNGGQIEKLMGDGIICVFGYPFIKAEEVTEFNLAERCSIELIEEFYGDNKEVKVALHDGEITYYKTPETYEEYTMVGRTITELYRLESVSFNNSINFYTGSSYDNYYNPFIKDSLSSIDKSNVSPFKKAVDLQGVSYKQIKFLKL